MMTAALIVSAQAQTITVDASTSIGRQALCQADWSKQTDPATLGMIGSVPVSKGVAKAHFLKGCRDKLKASATTATAQAPAANPGRR